MIEEIKEDNNCIVKAFENNPISILNEEHENKKIYYFKASDIGKALNLTNIAVSIQNYDEDERVIRKAYDTTNREQDTIFLSSKGVYRLLYNSKKPLAKKFRKWAGDILDDIIFNESKELKKKLEEIEAQKNLLQIELQEKTHTIDVLTKKTNKFKQGECVYIFRSSHDNKNIYKVGRTKNCNDREYSHKTATFDGEIVHQVMCSNSTVLEKVCHFLLDKYRVTTRREWFTSDFATIKNGVEYAKLILDSDINLEQPNILQLTKTFLDNLKTENKNCSDTVDNNQSKNNWLQFTELELKNYVNDPDNFDKFIEDCCEVGDGFSVSYIELKNQYKIWSKTANHHQLKKMIDHMKQTHTTTMKKANPLVSTSKVTGFFNRLKIKESLYKFEQPVSETLIIERYLFEHCQRSPGYRLTIKELYDDFEIFCKAIDMDCSYYTKEKIKVYFDTIFVRLRKGISNSVVDYRLGGWLGLSLKSNKQPEPFLQYKPKNRKSVRAIDIHTNELIKEWPSLTDASIDLHKSRTTLSSIIKRHHPINLLNTDCYLTN